MAKTFIFETWTPLDIKEQLRGEFSEELLAELHMSTTQPQHQTMFTFPEDLTVGQKAVFLDYMQRFGLKLAKEF